jgi:hypothetical protein
MEKYTHTPTGVYCSSAVNMVVHISRSFWRLYPVPRATTQRMSLLSHNVNKRPVLAWGCGLCRSNRRRNSVTGDMHNHINCRGTIDTSWWKQTLRPKKMHYTILRRSGSKQETCCINCYYNQDCDISNDNSNDNYSHHKKNNKNKADGQNNTA